MHFPRNLFLQHFSRKLETLPQKSLILSPTAGLAYEGRLSVLSASYDPQSSPDAKPPASSTPPAPKGTNGSSSGSHLPSPSATAATMFPFGMHQTAAAAPGLPDSSKGGFESSSLKSALEQPRPPTSRLDELFQSKSSQVGLSLSVPQEETARGKEEDGDDQEIKVEDDDEDGSGNALDKSNNGGGGGSSSLDRLREICNKGIVIQPTAPPGSPGKGD